VLVAAAAVVLLAVDRPTPRPRPVPVATLPVATLPAPPFDDLPGRTPIAEPSRIADRLQGRLPVTGSPGKPAAVAAVGLVLGRYCREPDRYVIVVRPTRADYRSVTGFAIGKDRSNDPPAVTLLLTWTGRAYAWSGYALQLTTGC
jgi:hypothetical protein